MPSKTFTRNLDLSIISSIGTPMSLKWTSRGLWGSNSMNANRELCTVAKWVKQVWNRMASASKFTRVMPFLRVSSRTGRSMDTEEESHHEVKCTRVNFSTIRWLVRDCTNGLMVVSSSAISKQGEKLAKESTCGPMDKYMMASLRMMTAMGRERYTIQMESDLTVPGKMAKNMERANMFGRTVLDTMCCTTMERKRNKDALKTVKLSLTNLKRLTETWLRGMCVLRSILNLLYRVQITSTEQMCNV